TASTAEGRAFRQGSVGCDLGRRVVSQAGPGGRLAASAGGRRSERASAVRRVGAPTRSVDRLRLLWGGRLRRRGHALRAKTPPRRAIFPPARPRLPLRASAAPAPDPCSSPPL